MKPLFALVRVSGPGVELRFYATKERIDKVLSVLLPEALEAEREFEAYLQEKPSDGTKAEPSDGTKAEK